MPDSLIVNPARAAELKAEAREIPVHDLSPEETDWIDLLLRGALGTGHVSMVASSFPDEERLALRDAEGVILAIAEKAHDGWRLDGLELPTRFDSLEFRLGPGEAVTGEDWRGAFCRVPVHRRGVERLTAFLSEESPERGLVMFLPASTTESGDFPHLPLQRMLGAAMRQLPASRVRLVVVPFPKGLEDSARHALEEEIMGAYGCVPLGSDWEEDLQEEAKEVAGLVESGSPDAVDATFPEVCNELDRGLPSASQQGYTVFFTGLSGSGKSTVARHLQVKLLEHGGRDVSLLDGDLVRKHLSSELGFSKEHRDINIRRIGYVASEVTKHGGAAVCCPIAPYDETRQAVRAMIEPVGGFILVHISTPVEVCEARDRKGLYAKARAGIIKEFTGISDPYETPEDADLSINTGEVSAEDAAESVMTLLRERGYVK